MIELRQITVVIMAKRPEPGRVKTRLVRAGVIDGAGAARLALAMLSCTVARLEPFGARVLAVSPDGCGGELARAVGAPGLRVVDQGSGDLGQRLARLWRRLGADRPLAFFGMDTPDVPQAALQALGVAMDEGELVLGPTADGGFWTIGGRTCHEAVLAGIDWGTSAVYHQVRRRAVTLGLGVVALPEWRDVDEPDDVEALRARVNDRLRCGPEGHAARIQAADAPLRALSEELERLRGDQGRATDHRDEHRRERDAGPA